MECRATLDQHFLRVSCKVGNVFRNNYFMQIMSVQLKIVSMEKTSQKRERLDWIGETVQSVEVSR